MRVGETTKGLVLLQAPDERFSLGSNSQPRNTRPPSDDSGSDK